MATGAPRFIRRAAPGGQRVAVTVRDMRASYGPVDISARRPAELAEVPAERDLVVEDAETGFCGAVVAC